MSENSKANAFILGVFIFLGLAALGYLLGDAAIKFKEYERTVTAKGLSEREYPADIVIWPIIFVETGNALEPLYNAIESKTDTIIQYLVGHGIDPGEITVSSPSINDKSANYSGDRSRPEFRYSARQTVTVYSKNIAGVRKIMSTLSELGKKGIVFTGESYQTQYLFTRLNEVKPEMIAEATKNAREVAAKFAADSKSRLGKIKRASQGQFSINSRDNNNPHIKKVRVVSTVVYYLSD